MRGIALILLRALAVWHCPYGGASIVCCVQPLLCGIALPCFQCLLCGLASILCTAVACVALPLSCLQLAVLLLNLMYNGCGVALPLPCLQRLCGFASILCTAVAVWHLPYPVTAQKRHSTLQQEKSKSTRQLLYIE